MFIFIKKLIIFLMPFLLIFAINITIDPFNTIRLFHTDLDKRSIAEPSDYRLFKINQFKSNPCDRIILGDSRAAAFDTNEIWNNTDNRYFNFGFGGGSLQEAFSTIDFAARLVQLKEIVVVLPFNLMDSSNQRNLFSQAEKISSNPLSYIMSFRTSIVSFKVLTYNLTGINAASETPNLSKEQFWIKQLELARDTYRGFHYSKEYETKLRSLSSLCNKKGIVVKVIIPPTHIDLQSLVTDYDLNSEWSDFKSLLDELFQVYDFDKRNSLTENKVNFKDPYHFEDHIMRHIISIVWPPTIER